MYSLKHNGDRRKESEARDADGRRRRQAWRRRKVKLLRLANVAHADHLALHVLAAAFVARQAIATDAHSNQFFY